MRMVFTAFQLTKRVVVSRGLSPRSTDTTDEEVEAAAETELPTNRLIAMDESTVEIGLLTNPRVAMKNVAETGPTNHRVAMDAMKVGTGPPVTRLIATNENMVTMVLLTRHLIAMNESVIVITARTESTVAATAMIEIAGVATPIPHAVELMVTSMEMDRDINDFMTQEDTVRQCVRILHDNERYPT
jgi:hypothetical protein